ncbi:MULTISPECIES: hypothetical protein [Clostridium]|uniref:Uncharacterized protein n=1 Tax=Clostridium aquiflavi TaxID=3073603 RepID=A0ABU1EFR0_9CLOT|nr:hypothetical protein [Clostridium sp. 5N-1]MDR5587232.1 hypothetical protein [Clostridium sp. 5N-1]NFG61900.1 hypothetical protein [Clostridium botulinum]NFQ08432.1 hypothetical protein [Clostridium botulinum]
MKSNTNKNPNQKNNYKEYLFWENRILNDHSLWEGYFDNRSITTESKIAYTGILDSEKGILKCGWVVYPSINALLGFLQHIFLPTSFLTYFDRTCEGFFIPVSTFDIITEEVIKNNSINISNLNSMIESYNFLNSLWESNEDRLLLELNLFCDKFNNNWDSDPEKKLFIKIFNSPSDTYEFITESIRWDFEEFIEEELSMSLSNLKFTCNNVINEPLLNKKFIDILNINIPILF